VLNYYANLNLNLREKGTIDCSQFVLVSTLLNDQFKDETGVCSGERAGKIVGKPDGRRPSVRLTGR
jgi:hypothetical protein